MISGRKIASSEGDEMISVFNVVEQHVALRKSSMSAFWRRVLEQPVWDNFEKFPGVVETLSRCWRRIGEEYLWPICCTGNPLLLKCG